MPTIAEKREQLASRGGATSVGDLIIPEVPRVDLPSDVAARFPSLAEWNRKHYTAWSDWRERTNVSLARLRA